MTDDHEAHPAPPTTRIYLPPHPNDLDGHLVEQATELPPPGSLDGWRSVDVSADTWEDYEMAHNRRQRLEREMHKALAEESKLHERLEGEVGRG